MSTTTSDPTTDADAWEAGLRRLRSRAPAEEFVTFDDQDAVALAQAKAAEVVQARRAARTRLVAAKTPRDELDAAIDADPAVQEAVQEHQTARESAQELAVTFHLRGLPPDVYERLQAAHPPTEAMENRGATAWNIETFPPALIAACSVKPITAEQVKALMEPVLDDDGNEVEPAAFNQGEVGVLIAACLKINEEPRLRLGKGSRPTAG